MAWKTTIERVRCASCGWKATRHRPPTCPECGSDQIEADRWKSYKVSYRDPSGRTRTKSFRLSADADAFLHEVETSKTRHEYRDPDKGKEPLGVYVATYVQASKKIGPSTRDLYGRMFRLYVDPAAISSTPIRAVTAEDLQRFLDDVATKTGARTVEIVRNLVSGALRRAVRLGSITSNPCSRLELAKPQKRPARFLTAQEVEAIADMIDPRYRALVLVSAFGALRFGEAAGLRRRDVGLRKLTIAGSVVQIGSKVERVDRTKTEGSMREVSIPASVMDELARHIAADVAAHSDALVFTAPEGGPLSRTVFRNRVWVPGINAAGIDPAPRFHDLRHTGVALAIKAGAHPRTIQSWVGHSSITTTMDVYGHLYDEAHEELAADLDALRADALARSSEAEVVKISEASGA